MQSPSLAHLNFLNQPVKALNNVLVWFILSSIFTLIKREKHDQIQKIIGIEVDKKSVIGFFQRLSLAAGQLYTIPLLAQPLSPAQHQVIDQALTIQRELLEASRKVVMDEFTEPYYALWSETLDAIQRQDFALLCYLLDSALVVDFARQLRDKFEDPIQALFYASFLLGSDQKPVDLRRLYLRNERSELSMNETETVKKNNQQLLKLTN